jgi:hypothetical protein
MAASILLIIYLITVGSAAFHNITGNAERPLPDARRTIARRSKR